MFMSGAATGFCSDKRAPHGPFNLCAACLAEKYLTEDDQLLLGFYNLVADQYVNQTPMGTKDGPPVTTLRVEALQAALKVFRYPREIWGWLLTGARMYHLLVTGQDTIDWIGELGKPFQDVQPEDVTHGN